MPLEPSQAPTVGQVVEIEGRSGMEIVKGVVLEAERAVSRLVGSNGRPIDDPNPSTKLIIMIPTDQGGYKLLKEHLVVGQDIGVRLAEDQEPREE